MASIELERKSSIELEPRTLSFRELQLARESAISIMKNNSLEEAIKIFTDHGLQQSVARIEGNSRLDDFSYVDSEEEGDEDQMMNYYSFRL